MWGRTAQSFYHISSNHMHAHQRRNWGVPLPLIDFVFPAPIAARANCHGSRTHLALYSSEARDDIDLRGLSRVQRGNVIFLSIYQCWTLVWGVVICLVLVYGLVFRKFHRIGYTRHHMQWCLSLMVFSGTLTKGGMGGERHDNLVMHRMKKYFKHGNRSVRLISYGSGLAWITF